jgi:hypothetical protein
MYEEHLLPPSTRLIHIGPPKTGTTAVQSAFQRVRDRLPDHGVHYAGPGSRPRAAVTALTRFAPGVETDMTAWDELSHEVRAAGDLRVCISNEGFAKANWDQAARAAADLGGDRAHVVMVVRPLGALLPSQWQQRVRRRRTMISYDAWLRIVLGDTPDREHHPHFWVMHDLPDQIERWSAATSPDRVHVVVSDEADRSFLPRLFEGFLGLPEGLLVPGQERANRSLDLAEAELLRALDRMADERGWRSDLWEGDLKQAFSKALRAAPPVAPLPITLPEWAEQRVEELNEHRRSTLATAKVDVIGDPDSLVSATRRSPVEAPPEAITVHLEVATALAGTMVDGMLKRQEALQRTARQQQRRLQRLSASPPAAASPARRLASRVRRRLRRVA